MLHRETALESSAQAQPVCFDVLDVLGGLSELRRASATLDGSIPVRAAQACSPLLDGNRFGFQLGLTKPLEIARGVAGLKLVRVPEMLDRAYRGSIPRLFAEGLLDEGWQRTLDAGLVSRGKNKGELRLFTGLLVRPRPSHVLRIGHAGNRRNLLFDVEERFVRESQRFVPLLLSLRFQRDTSFPVTLSGELCTLAVFDPRYRITQTELAERPESGRRHASFFDRTYFDDKKTGPTQKYKRLVSEARAAERSGPSELCVVRAGTSMTRVVRASKLIGPAGMEEDASFGLEAVSFENGVPIDAVFDGQNCHVKLDAPRLAEHRDACERAWQASFDATFLSEHVGARLYFDKYSTPHQAGEPYFFVKPPALFHSSPGWSLLVDGAMGNAYSVLRGVTASDAFHAAPAVIRLDVPGRHIRIAAGDELSKLYPFPRPLSTAKFESIAWRWAPRLGDDR